MIEHRLYFEDGYWWLHTPNPNYYSNWPRLFRLLKSKSDGLLFMIMTCDPWELEKVSEGIKLMSQSNRLDLELSPLDQKRSQAIMRHGEACGLVKQLTDEVNWIRIKNDELQVECIRLFNDVVLKNSKLR